MNALAGRKPFSAEKVRKEIVLLVPRFRETWFYAETIANTLCHFAVSEGGACWAGWVNEVVKLRIQGIPRWRLRIALKALFDAFLEDKTPLTLIEMSAEFAPLPARESVPWGIIVEKRLSKRLLLSLPAGAYVTSVDRKGRCRFCAKLGAKPMRETVWLSALISHAAHRKCRVAWSANQFKEQLIV